MIYLCYNVIMPYKDRERHLAYQRWYSKTIRKKKTPWYKRSPENYQKHLKSQRLQREKRRQLGFKDAGWYYYKKKRNDFIKAVGKCQNCGYNDIDALVLHHKDPLQDRNMQRYNHKNFTNAINHGQIILLCANCHILYHKNHITLPIVSSGQLSLSIP